MHFRKPRKVKFNATYTYLGDPSIAGKYLPLATSLLSSIAASNAPASSRVISPAPGVRIFAYGGTKVPYRIRIEASGLALVALHNSELSQLFNGSQKIVLGPTQFTDFSFEDRVLFIPTIRGNLVSVNAGETWEVKATEPDGIRYTLFDTVLYSAGPGRAWAPIRKLRDGDTQVRGFSQPQQQVMLFDGNALVFGPPYYPATEPVDSLIGLNIETGIEFAGFGIRETGGQYGRYLHAQQLFATTAFDPIRDDTNSLAHSPLWGFNGTVSKSSDAHDWRCLVWETDTNQLEPLGLPAINPPPFGDINPLTTPARKYFFHKPLYLGADTLMLLTYMYDRPGGIGGPSFELYPRIYISTNFGASWFEISGVDTTVRNQLPAFQKDNNQGPVFNSTWSVLRIGRRKAAIIVPVFNIFTEEHCIVFTVEFSAEAGWQFSYKGILGTLDTRVEYTNIHLVDSIGTDAMMAVCRTDSDPFDYHFLRSVDAGATWQRVEHPQKLLYNSQFNGLYHAHIRPIAPVTDVAQANLALPLPVFLGDGVYDMRVALSQDGGLTWVETNDDLLPDDVPNPIWSELSPTQVDEFGINEITVTNRAPLIRSFINLGLQDDPAHPGLYEEF